MFTYRPNSAGGEATANHRARKRMTACRIGGPRLQLELHSSASPLPVSVGGYLLLFSDRTKWPQLPANLPSSGSPASLPSGRPSSERMCRRLWPSTRLLRSRSCLRCLVSRCSIGYGLWWMRMDRVVGLGTLYRTVLTSRLRCRNHPGNRYVFSRFRCVYLRCVYLRDQTRSLNDANRIAWITGWCNRC